MDRAAKPRVMPASAGELDAACALMATCRRALEAQRLFQWDAQYPSHAFFRDAIEEGCLFALFDQEQMVGVVVLNQWEPPEWNSVAWAARSGFLVIHAFAIAPHVQGHGYGNALLAFCEGFAAEQCRASIHLDAFSENAAALRFYERRGYSFRGEVRLASKPVGHQQYRCYEKLVSPSPAVAARRLG